MNHWAFEGTTETWRKEEGCKYAIPSDAKATSKCLMSKNRWALKTLVAVLTGHCGLNRHLRLLEIGDNPVCLQCGTGKETSYHLIEVCHRWSSIKRRFLGTSTLSCRELFSLVWGRILAFVRKTGRFF